MSEKTLETGTLPQERRRWTGLSDVVISLGLLVLFVWAGNESLDWPTRSRLVPLVVSVLGASFCVLKLIHIVVQTRSGELFATVDDAPPAVPAPDEVEVTVGTKLGVDVSLADEEDDDESLDYAFAHAGRAAWTRAIGWIGGFLAGVWVVGFTLTLPVFTVLYLRLENKVGWRGSIIAALATVAFIFGIPALGVEIRMPEGVLGLS